MYPQSTPFQLPLFPLDKCCRRCGRSKPITDFHRHPKMADGHLNICKVCKRADIRQWQRDPSNKERVNAARRRSYTKWAAAHPDKIALYKKQWYARHKAQRQVYHSVWYAQHRDAVMAANRERYRANAQAYAEARRAYHARNREALRAARTRWAKAHPEVSRCAVRRRRARLTGNGGTHAARDIAALYNAQDGRCAYCGVALAGAFHVDHMLPLSRRGGNGPENLALACASCNCAKGAQTAEEFRSKRAQ